MRSLSASQLLALWEQGLAQPGWQRALSLLAASQPDFAPDALAHLPLGQRDAQLLTLRENLFGPRLTSLVICPACGERLELAFEVGDIRVGSLTDQESEHESDHKEGPLSVATGGFHVTFRLPNSLDLARISALSDQEQARQALLAGCLLSLEEKGAARTVADLPESVISAIAEHMANADPQGDVQFGMTCPSCSHQWQAAFDPISYIWHEISAWAQRILREVHLLARAYSWRETDILALSPSRREIYLQMVMESA